MNRPYTVTKEYIKDVEGRASLTLLHHHFKTVAPFAIAES